jgi:hypothetical protein
MVAASSETGSAARSEVIVATSSDPTGAPQDEQKRPAAANPAPQLVQVYTVFSADSVLASQVRLPPALCRESHFGLHCGFKNRDPGKFSKFGRRDHDEVFSKGSPSRVKNNGIRLTGFTPEEALI